MSSATSPCAACKLQRRKCTQECVFAPYFPPDQPQKFENVHKVFGASNVAKILNELSAAQREDAVNSLAYEADARLRDPVYGCVGLISILQHRLKQVQIDLYNAKKELASYIGPSAMLPILQHHHTGFIQQHPNNSSSSSVIPYNISPAILSFPAGNAHQLVIHDPHLQLQQQHHHHHHHHPHHQILEAQRLAAAKEQQGMLATYDHQQQQHHHHHQQELVRFNGGFDPAAGQVGGANGFAAQMSGAAMSPSLGLGCFDDPYQIQEQPQDHSGHNHQLQLQLQPQILIQQQQPQPPKQQQRSGSEDGRRVGRSC